MGRGPGSDIVYFGAGNGLLYALNASDGTPRWSYDTTPADPELGDRNDVNGSPALGQTGIVIRQIIPSEDAGQVRVEGQVWRALANDVIDEGTKVKVDKISGAKLYVSKIDENE